MDDNTTKKDKHNGKQKKTKRVDNKTKDRKRKHNSSTEHANEAPISSHEMRVLRKRPNTRTRMTQE
eukprot:3372901-Prorocentrum_lima.AAC.1